MRVIYTSKVYAGERIAAEYHSLPNAFCGKCHLRAYIMRNASRNLHHFAILRFDGRNLIECQNSFQFYKKILILFDFVRFKNIHIIFLQNANVFLCVSRFFRVTHIIPKNISLILLSLLYVIKEL